MALIVEDGTGVANADSYASVAEADTLATSIGNPHSWVARALTDKEVALRLATSYVDREFGPRYTGYRVDKDQSLQWPRQGACYTDGWDIEDDELPKAVKDAAIYAAMRIANGETFTDTSTTDGTIKKTRDKVGPLETEVEYEAAASGETPAPRDVEDTIAPVLGSIGSTDRG